MNYMLDTDTCIYLMIGRHPERQSRILAKLDKLAPDENLLLSSVTTTLA